MGINPTFMSPREPWISKANLEDERIASILDSSELAWWDWDLRTNEIAWNTHHYTLLGLKPFEVRPSVELFMDRLHPDDVQTFRKNLKEAIRNRESYQIEYRVIWPDGSTHTIVGKGKALYSNRNEPERILGTAFEVTYQKRMEAEVRRNLECFEAMDQTIPFGIWKCDASGKFDFVSHSFLTLTDMNLTEMNDGGWQRLLTSEQAQKWNECLARGKNWEATIQIHNDLDSKTILSRGRPLFAGSKDGKKTIIGWIGINLDINDRIEIENALLKSEERLTLSLMAAHMATFEINLKKEHLIMSGRWHDLFGAEAPIPNWNLENFMSRVHPEDREELESEIQQTIEGKKEIYSLIYRVIWPDGSVHYISERAKLQKNSLGKPLFVHGAMIDVTPLKQTESRLHEAIRARNEFISIAAHELRTPLSTLAIHTQLATRQLEKNATKFLNEENVKKVFENSNRQISQLVNLVDKLLDVSRTMNGGFSLKPERFLVNELIKETVAAFQCEAEKIKTSIVLEAPSEAVYGIWDKHRIQQVIGNILSNAIKFGDSKPIKVKYFVDDSRLNIQIQDHGQGISEELQKKLFERFQRKSDDFLSMGLGLYISKQIIDAHLGSIKVESKLNEGTLIRICLPLEPDNSCANSPWTQIDEN